MVWRRSTRSTTRSKQSSAARDCCGSNRTAAPCLFPRLSRPAPAGDDQRAGHARIIDAVKADGPGPPEHRSAAFSRRQIDVETSVARGGGVAAQVLVDPQDGVADAHVRRDGAERHLEIGRASCRERVWQYV